MRDQGCVTISIINGSSTVCDSEVHIVAAALQQQISNDLRPVWEVDAILSVVSNQSTLPPEAWTLNILDESDQRGALGYHLCSSSGVPYGKAFASSAMQCGKPWSVVASHELLEMLVNPNADSMVPVLDPDRSTARFYAREICDPCEPARYGYRIGGVLVSNFVYPSWFETDRGVSPARFDHRHHIRMPFQVCPGGYISVFDACVNQGWRTLS